MLCLPREERASCAAPTTRCLSYAPCSALRTGEAETIHHSGTAWRSFPVTAPGTTKGGGVEEKKIIQDRIPHPRHSSIGNHPACLSKKGQRSKESPKARAKGRRSRGLSLPTPPFHAFTPARPHASTLPVTGPHPDRIELLPSLSYPDPYRNINTNPSSQQSEHFASAL